MYHWNIKKNKSKTLKLMMKLMRWRNRFPNNINRIKQINVIISNNLLIDLTYNMQYILDNRILRFIVMDL